MLVTKMSVLLSLTNRLGRGFLDFGALRRLCYSQPLKDAMPVVQKVACPDSIQVSLFSVSQ